MVTIERVWVLLTSFNRPRFASLQKSLNDNSGITFLVG